MSRPAALRLLLACALLAATAARADNCQNVGAAILDFGPYDPTAGARDVDGFIPYSCSNKATPMVYLGAGGSGNPAARAMASGPYRLSYNLYTTALRATVWGGAVGVLAPGGKDQTLPIYGRIPGSQMVPPGPYADQLVVTFVF